MYLSSGIHLGGRYEIVSQLGAGGMGEVYKARDLRLGRDVAVKVLPEHLAKDSSALSRFEREGKAVAALSHPNILAIHDFGTDNGVSFAVMELLEGETLRDRIKSSPLPWRNAVEVALAIAEGLSAAHSKGVIHRDLKPENIFLTSDGQVKILDFGLAQWKATTLEQELSSAPTDSHISQKGSVMGTVPYMSPEQVRGTSIDVRSDIFAFGSVLCEMLTGTRAFGRTTAADTMAAILKEEPNEIDQLRGKIAVELQRTISHCLEKNPEQRFQTARDLAFDLKATLSGSDMVRPLVLKSQIRPAVWTAAILSLLVLGALLYTYTIRNHPIRSVAILPFVNETKDTNNELLIDGITENLINSLTQLPDLRVIARDTVFHYKNQARDPRKIGRDLKVEAVVTGRVTQQGDSLVVSTGLVRIADGSQLWGEKYNRKLSDLVKIETDISKEIAEKLRLRLTGDQKRLLEKRPTENAESYRLYLKGKYHWFKNTEEDYEKSREYFQEAIDIDPAYSLAHAWLGQYFMAMAFEGYRAPKEVWPKAEAAYKKALEIDPDLALGHIGRGFCKGLYRWEWRAAEEDLRRGLALDPSFGRRGYSQFLLASGRTDEAIQELKAALDSDPLNRVYSVNLGQYLTIAGTYDEAIQQLLQTIDMDPNYDAAHFSLANAYERKGMYEEAAAEWKKGYLAQKNEDAAALFDDVQDKSAYFEVMRTIAEENVVFLVELSQERYVSPVNIAKYYAQLDQKEEAFRWLEKALGERSTQLVFLKVDHNWDNLHSDPRFADLAKRIGLP